MSVAEIRWRVVSACRDRVDRVRTANPAWVADPAVRAQAGGLARSEPPRLCDVPVGSWAGADPASPQRGWCQRLAARADAILDGRLEVFGRELQVGVPPVWNREHLHGKTTPLVWAGAVDYRDFAIAGDAKIVWEPNRHHHLVVLACAYRATGDQRYARGVLDHLTSWLDQCPFGRGINWRSPLELAIRLINWTYAFDFIRDSGQLTPEFCRRFLAAVHLQLRDITRKFSRGSSANNHLIGEAAGVFVASSYFAGLSGAKRWREQSHAILCREVLTQTFADGGGREQATAYHVFVFQLLLVAALTGRSTGSDFPATFWDRLERMLDFVVVLSGGTALPAFGDSDMGYVLDLGQAHDQTGASLAVGATVFSRPDFRAGQVVPSETVRWLLGAQASDAELRADAPGIGAPVSTALEQSGYYVLRARLGDSLHEVAAVLDCGPLGFTALAAHGHADALSLVVHAFGRELLVDPGTFDYFTFPEYRDYFRSTRAHSTITVDGKDQSEQLGLFLWGARASARCITWAPDLHGGLVAGEHDGYRRLADPVIHRRLVRLDGARQLLTVRDELSMTGEHEIRLAFHLAEDCVPQQIDDRTWQIALGPYSVRLTGDPRLVWSAVRGAEAPIGGWVSRQYHAKQPSVTLSGRVVARGDTILECAFEFLPAPNPPNG